MATFDHLTPFSLYKRKLAKGSYWYVRFRDHDGKFGTGHNSGQTGKHAALLWAQAFLTNQHEELLRQQARSIPSLQEYSQGFFSPNGPYAQTLLLYGRRPPKDITLKDHERRMELHLLPILGTKQLTSIASSDFARLQQALNKKGLAGQSIVHVVNTLSIMLKQAAEDGLIDHVPQFRRVAIRTKQRGSFSIEEARLILSSTWESGIHRTINLVAATTGMRQSEILGLRWEAIQSDHIEVFATWFEPTRTLSGSRTAPATKAGRIRYVPIPDETITALQILRTTSPFNRPCDFVFPRDENRPIPNHTVLQVFQKQLNALGIGPDIRKERGLCFHSWRHFYNSALVNGRIPLTKVQAVVGHTSERMTSTYYHADEMSDVRNLLNTIIDQS